jgi:hypothetical protein
MDVLELGNLYGLMRGAYCGQRGSWFLVKLVCASAASFEQGSLDNDIESTERVSTAWMGSSGSDPLPWILYQDSIHTLPFINHPADVLLRCCFISWLQRLKQFPYRHTYNFFASSVVQHGALYHCNCRSAVNKHLHRCIAHQAAWQSSKKQMGCKQRHVSLMIKGW